MLTQEQQIEQLTQQVEWLITQVANVYARLQLPYAQRADNAAQNPRTETGMGPIISSSDSPYL